MYENITCSEQVFYSDTTHVWHWSVFNIINTINWPNNIKLWHWHFRLTHWGWDKMAAIFQTTYSIAFSLMKMYKFRWRLGILRDLRMMIFFPLFHGHILLIKFCGKVYTSQQGFSNQVSDWLVAMPPANQKPGLKILTCITSPLLSACTMKYNDYIYLGTLSSHADPKVSKGWQYNQ